MSVTPEQVGLIQDSFSKVVPIADKAAEIFYAKLFEFDPSLKSLFKSDITEQGKKLMQTLGVAVNGLRDLDKLVPVLEDLAVKHVSYGVKVDDYTPVANALLYTLKTGLGEAYTSEVKQAWVDLLKVVVQVMRSAAYPDFNAASYKNTKHYHH